MFVGIRRVINFLFFMSALVLAGCGGGGGNGSSGQGSNTDLVVDNESPQFEGFALVVSGNTDQASAAWMPATDNVTVADNMQYELYLATSASFVPSNTSLYQTYTGETSANITGLSAGTEYFFKIIAVDKAGNKIEAVNHASVKTATDAILRSSNIVNDAKDLNLGFAQVDSIDNSIYTFSLNANSITPEVGSILIGEDADGNGYLRKVDTVTQDATTLTVGTSDASLSDVFENATISSEMVLRASDLDVTNNVLALPRSISLSNKTSANQQRLEWKDNLLTIIESDQSVTAQNLSRQVSALDPSNTKINVSASKALTLTGDIRFEPTVKTYVTWYALTVTEAYAQLSGSLSMDLTLAYDYDGVASISEVKEVFSRTYLSRYLVGGIPVYQETTLTLNAKFSGKSTSAIQAESKASVSSNVTINVAYDGNQWSSSTTKSFDNNLTVSANALGTATAEVRIIPEVKVRFYKVASSTISVEPYTSATVKAEAVTAADLVVNNYMGEFGFTQFDAYVGADVNLVADLSIFSRIIARYPETGKKNLYKLEEQLFGLPTLEASLQGIPNINGNDLNLVATATPFVSAFGLENSFDINSAQWVIFPSIDTINGLIGSWKPLNHGSVYKAYFMGNSEMLGPVGQQYIEATFTLPGSAVPAELDMQDDDGDGMPNVWESYYGLNLTINDAEDDFDGDGDANLKEYQLATDPTSLTNPGTAEFPISSGIYRGDGSIIAYDWVVVNAITYTLKQYNALNNCVISDGYQKYEYLDNDTVRETNYYPDRPSDTNTYSVQDFNAGLLNNFNTYYTLTTASLPPICVF